MRAFTFVDVCSPGNLQILQGGAFDADNDLVLDATEAHIAFRKPLENYAWIEVDLTSTDAADQSFSFFSARNIQLPLDGQPTFISAATLHPGDVKTIKLPYSGEIEGFLITAGLNARIKAVRIIQLPQNFVTRVDADVVIPNFPSGDGWIANPASGSYTLSLAPGSNHAVSIASLLANLAEDGWVFVEVRASNNYGSTQTTLNHEAVYSSEPIQRFYFDSGEMTPKSLTFHARAVGGCTIVVSVLLGQFQAPISAFGGSSAVLLDSSLRSAPGGSGIIDTSDFFRISRNLNEGVVATMRTNLGLGTMAVQAASNVAVTGGTVLGLAALAATVVIVSGLAGGGTQPLGVDNTGQVVAIAASGPTIGNPVGGGTPFDVLFVDSLGNLGQDDNFQWNGQYLLLGTAAQNLAITYGPAPFPFDAITTGNSNLAFGIGTLFSVTTGAANHALGTNALGSLVTGDFNLAVGANSSPNWTAGNFNVAVGTNCVAGGSGDHNIGIGNMCLYDTVTSNYNIGIGYQAMYAGLDGGSDNIAIGYKAGYSISTGSENVAIGTEALKNNATGIENVCIGNASGDGASGAINGNVGVGVGSLAGIAADYNVAVGYYALSTAASGPYNVAIGYTAGNFIGSGESNIAIGNTPMNGSNSTLITGNDNIGIGQAALTALSSGSNNIAIGANALLGPTPAGNITGNSNIGIGPSALGSISTGSYNIALGHNALTSITTPSDNIALGHGVLSNATTGAQNVGIGSSALEQILTHNNNTGIGYQAGQNLETDNNTAVGAFALKSVAGGTGTRNTAVGVSAMGGAQVDGDENTAHGYLALGSLTTGAYNVAVGRSAGDTLTTGNRNVFIGGGNAPGNGADGIAGGTNQIAIGSQVACTASNQIRIGDANITDSYITGALHLVKKLYLPTPAGAAQTASAWYSVTGVPSNADGGNGDYCSRSDGGVGAHIYFKAAGAWVAVI